MSIITDVSARDLRFPTSVGLHGSDAMNSAPDYSATYVTVRTDRGDGLEGVGLTFTIGRGNELCVAAVNSLRPLLLGQCVEDLFADMGSFWRTLTGDSQLRWLGPEKGVIHLATAAVVNAVWDLFAKAERKPLWQLLCDMAPDEIVRCVDFRYITDAITPHEALELLEAQASTRNERRAKLEDGYPAYTTSAGWIGYDLERVRELARAALADGWRSIKIKVGGDPDDDVSRVRVVREQLGADGRLMLDANQVWDVQEAIANTRRFAQFDPLWIEEPTSPDDVVGHAAIRSSVAPIGVATGEHCANRVMFKQLLQLEAIDFCQIDACRLAGVNEVIAVLLMAAKFGVPVCPHGGGVGLCEYVQHVSMFDYVCVSGSLEGRMIEYVDHLHEHFEEPVRIRNGRYLPPMAPGYSAAIKPQSLVDYEFPQGRAWRPAITEATPK